MNHTAQILALHDAGHDAATIATSLQRSTGYVYGVLRTHRPDRPRKARTATSDRPRMVRGLAAQGIVVERIAVLCGVSRAYCYRILANSGVSAISRRFSPDNQKRWLPTIDGQIIVGGSIPFSGYNTKAEAIEAARARSAALPE